MEKDVALGSVGTLALAFAAGKATLSVQIAVPGGLTATVQVVEDAGALIDLLSAALAKAVPATAAIDPAVFGVVKAAVQAIA